MKYSMKIYSINFNGTKRLIVHSLIWYLNSLIVIKEIEKQLQSINSNVNNKISEDDI